MIDILWRQDIDLGAGREIFDYSHRQKESEVDKELSDGRERGDGWRSGGNQILERNLLVDGETGESFPAQVTAPGSAARGGHERRHAWLTPGTHRRRVCPAGRGGLTLGRRRLPAGGGNGRVAITVALGRGRLLLGALWGAWQGPLASPRRPGAALTEPARDWVGPLALFGCAVTKPLLQGAGFSSPPPSSRGYGCSCFPAGARRGGSDSPVAGGVP